MASTDLGFKIKHWDTQPQILILLEHTFQMSFSFILLSSLRNMQELSLNTTKFTQEQQLLLWQYSYTNEKQ